MRQKILAVLLLFSIILLNPIQAKQEETGSEFQTIPDEAIRLRILANSDSDEDQELKHLIRDEVNAEISEWVEHIDNINAARRLIENNINKVEQTVERVLEEQDNQQSVDVQYKSNITFPMKLYDNYLYPPGEYEAVLITLGEGKGSNWWCVLFPPLCFLDFSNGTTVAEVDDPVDGELINEETEKEETVEVKFFLFEWLGWS